MKWIYVLILEKCSYVEYFYTQINNNQMQRELFNNMFRSSLYVYMFQLQPALSIFSSNSWK